MSSDAKSLTPEVTWAQRSSATEASKNFIYLTIGAADVPDKEMKVDLQPGSLIFSGYSHSKKATYAVTLDFYSEIDPSASKISHSARDVEIKLQKKELKEEYWPRLLKEKAKYHFLHTDFDKWVDEDEQDGVPDDDYMNQMGGDGGMPGMGGMGGMGGEGGFGGLDFSKLGGMGGAGMGGMDMSALAGMGGDEGEDDDDDVPDLDDEEGESSEAGAAEATASSSKIEEVE